MDKGSRQKHNHIRGRSISYSHKKTEIFQYNESKEHLYNESKEQAMKVPVTSTTGLLAMWLS